MIVMSEGPNSQYLHACFPKGQKRDMELELQVTVNIYVGTRNQTQVPLQKQPVLLIAEPSLQALFSNFKTT